MGMALGIALVWFIIEMLLWYLIAQFISGWWVFGWFIVAVAIGVVLLKNAAKVLKPMGANMQAAMLNPSTRPPENVLVGAAAKSVAGLLLILPGVLSDLIAVLLLLPPVQAKLKKIGTNYVMNNQEKMMQMMMRQMGGAGGNPFGGMGGQNPFGNSPFGQNPFGQNGRGTTIDGEAVVKRKSANDNLLK